MKFIAIILSTLLATAAVAQGNKNGFSSETESGQGNLNNSNVQSNPGTTSETTTGPKGQIDKGATDCNNCETTTDLPGNNR